MEKENLKRVPRKDKKQKNKDGEIKTTNEIKFENLKTNCDYRNKEKNFKIAKKLKQKSRKKNLKSGGIEEK